MGFYSGRDYKLFVESDDETIEDVTIDLDNGNSVDLQAVEDHVEPYNVEDVAAAQVGHPNDDEPFDPVEESCWVMYESQYNWNQILQATAMKELNESYRGVVNEGFDDIKAFFVRVRDMFVKLLKKVAAIVKKWIDNVSATLRTDKSFLEKYGDRLEAGKKAMKEKLKGYPYPSNLGDAGVKDAMSNAMLAEIKSQYGVDVKTGNVSVTAANTSGSEYSALSSGIRGTIAKYAPGVKAAPLSAEQFRKTLFNAFHGGDKKVDMLMDVADIKNTLAKSDVIEKAKKSYKEFEKSINDILKGLKKLERTTEKDYNKKDDNTSASDKNMTLNSIRQAISGVQEGANAMQVYNSSWLSAMRGKHFQARAFANRYVYAANKGKKDDKGVQKEAGYLANVTLI